MFEFKERTPVMDRYMRHYMSYFEGINVTAKLAMLWAMDNNSKQSQQVRELQRAEIVEMLRTSVKDVHKGYEPYPQTDDKGPVGSKEYFSEVLSSTKAGDYYTIHRWKYLPDCVSNFDLSINEDRVSDVEGFSKAAMGFMDDYYSIIKVEGVVSGLVVLGLLDKHGFTLTGEVSSDGN